MRGGTSRLSQVYYLTALGRYDEAEAALRKAIALQPQSAESYFLLSRCQICAVNPAPKCN